MKTCYIKPTRYRHDSGYRTFEVGYVLEMKDRKVEKKKVLGQYSDHIYTDFFAGIQNGGKQPFGINMDLTLDGYIRIWSHAGDLEWENGFDNIFSSAQLNLKEKS